LPNEFENETEVLTPQPKDLEIEELPEESNKDLSRPLTLNSPAQGIVNEKFEE
jgi:hypothetical protein